MLNEKWLELNSKLQKKKNQVRKKLNSKGVLKKGKRNNFDNYYYFSEAQYKVLFTELFSECGLELKFNELEYGMFEGSEKQSNGRLPKLMFTLFDIDTGFYEETTITGEAIDKGDKGGFKAFTGALKYYLATTFLVATGDDPEKDNITAKMNTRTDKNNIGKTISPKQKEIILKYYKDEMLAKLLNTNNISTIDDLPISKATEIIGILMNNGGLNE